MNRTSVAPLSAGDGAFNFDGVWPILKARRVAVAGSITFAAVMIIYLRTMMPGPAFMDTGEFQTVTYVLGVAHPTGYPLYTIVGKLFGTLAPDRIMGLPHESNVSVVRGDSRRAADGARASLPCFPARGGGRRARFRLLAKHLEGRRSRRPLHADRDDRGSALVDGREVEGNRRAPLVVDDGAGFRCRAGECRGVVDGVPAVILYVVMAQPRKFFWPPTMIVAGLLGVFGLVGIYLYLPLRASMHPPLNYGNTYTWQGFQFVALGGQVGGIINYLTWEGLRIFLHALPRVVDWYSEWLTPVGLALVALLA